MTTRMAAVLSREAIMVEIWSPRGHFSPGAELNPV